jgi:hypothetical protein
VNLSVGEAEFVICVIDRNLSFQRFIELDLGTSEAEALWLGRDLEASSVPLHDVVVANHALVMEAADVVEIFGSRPPNGFGFARRATEAPIVVRQEAAQDLVGGDEIVGSGQTQFTGETILESAPEAFDASFGLRTSGRDVGDAELFQSAAELRGLAATGELFFHRPVIVIANEDAVAIPVETERDAEAAEQAPEQAKITVRIFGREEFGDENFAGGVVQKAEQGKLWTAIFEPAMKAGVEQDHFAFASAGQAALAMSGSASLAGRADPGRAQQTAKGLAPDREAFLLDQFFAQVMVVEADIGGAGQMQDAIPHAIRQAARAGPSAAGGGGGGGPPPPPPPTERRV